ncbi:SDR family oxidoreductase [Desulfobulbus rhabdoformis]|jgi:NAD(P)-dependent dehydrogenase (short-subunit alcohol dehydrogenase family)|uniref:SDR family NAD(P)-dependent oxidoreductase n=1 Tax=Desulfobulbus rhabdoformis TaxID=34032 RepID=UPI001963065F|nr:SDR family oxidoreductase [Desulfobulbus rhabdoformis]MBM9615092.1 SDR family oxidoreductase [Desulfobulbus rhabdoformis]
MHLDLTGKSALVTASSEGIGFAIAQGLASSGATIILNGRSQEKLKKAEERLVALVPTATVRSFAVDLAQSTGCDALVEATGPVDILVNNAGIYGPLDFFDTDDATWDRYWQTNVMSGVRLSRAYLPAMQDKDWGRIVFIASESARNIPADMIHYGVSKTAQLALSRGLAKRVAGSGITVNAVLPGPTLSDGFQAMMAEEMARTGKTLETLAQEFIAANRPSSILKRAASVEEVANMVVYVCSPQASATTGAALRVDGGVVDDII